jgi:hypothetical protein
MSTQYDCSTSNSTHVAGLSTTTAKGTASESTTSLTTIWTFTAEVATRK